MRPYFNVIRDPSKMNINLFIPRYQQHTLLLFWCPVQLKAAIPPLPCVFIIILRCPLPGWQCLCAPVSPSPSSLVAAAASCWRPWPCPRSRWGWPWELSTRWWGRRGTFWPSTRQGGSPACPPAEPCGQVRAELTQCLRWTECKYATKDNFEEDSILSNWFLIWHINQNSLYLVNWHLSCNDIDIYYDHKDTNYDNKRFRG